jgi:glycosyltransferase involved in cell wall biosynthesis
MRRVSAPDGKRTYVVGCDHQNDIRVFSGSTYHLALEGVKAGLLTGMVNLHPRGIGGWPVYARAAWWRYRGALRGRYGFKFTDRYLDGIWKRGLPALRESRVINNFQLFGPRFLERHEVFDIAPYFYIDASLGEYFGEYRDFDTAHIDGAAMRHALAAERLGYAVCRKLMVMSKRTASYIRQHYDVPQEKIRIVPPGANIAEHLLEKFEQMGERSCRPDGKSLVIGFIGLYPERKGLPTIADAVQLLRRAGYDVRLHVIGKCPPAIAQQGGVTHFGLIDKRAETDRFVEIVGNVDVGCMLSRAELAGIAYLEFLRMGVPVVATDIGGAPEIVELGAGDLVSPEISAAELARHFASMIDAPDRLADLRETAWRRRHNASWRRAVGELKAALDE